MESRQRSHSEQADVISRRNHRVEASKKVADFGGVGDIHALDHERNILFSQFADDVIAMKMLPVQDSEVRPFASRFLLRVADEADQIGPLGISAV